MRDADRAVGSVGVGDRPTGGQAVNLDLVPGEDGFDEINRFPWRLAKRGLEAGLDLVAAGLVVNEADDRLMRCLERLEGGIGVVGGLGGAGGSEEGQREHEGSESSADHGSPLGVAGQTGPNGAIFTAAHPSMVLRITV